MSTADSIERCPIEGFPGYYISEDGRVWSSKRVVYFKGVKPGAGVAYDGEMKELTSRPSNRSPGYMVIVLVDSARVRRTRLVHRLVLEAFVGPCPDGMECRHLDGNAKNNHLSNLAWGTPAENCDDKRKHGRQCHMRGELNGHAILTDSQVLEIRARWAKGGVTQKKLAKDYSTSASNIRFIVTGATWKHI